MQSTDVKILCRQKQDINFGSKWAAISSEAPDVPIRMLQNLLFILQT